MKINPVNKTIQINIDNLESTYYALRHAIKCIREMSGLPLTSYERDTAVLELADHAMKSIIEAGESIGLDMGGKWGNQVDVSKAS